MTQSRHLETPYSKHPKKHEQAPLRLEIGLNANRALWPDLYLILIEKRGSKSALFLNFPEETTPPISGWGGFHYRLPRSLPGTMVFHHFSQWNKL